MPITIQQETPQHPEVVKLIQALDTYQQELYPPESNHLEDIASLSRPNVYFVVARSDTEYVGCGAVINCDNIYGEMKRVFVKPEMRGRRIAESIVEALESHLRRLEVPMMRLETGIYQTSAIRLYERMGYERRPPFGNYTDDPLSVFMEKSLRR